MSKSDRRVFVDKKLQDFKHGDLMFKNRFALLPTIINGEWIWFKRYQQLYEWQVKERYGILFMGKYALPEVLGMWGDWELISEKVL